MVATESRSHLDCIDGPLVEPEEDAADDALAALDPSAFLPEPTAALTRAPKTMRAELRTAQRGSRKPW